MKKIYNCQNLLLATVLILVVAMASCKKDKTTPTPKVINGTPVNIGLFEAGFNTDSAIYRLLFMNITKVGTQTVNYQLIFDTGSGGMVLDADSIVPKSMITDNGFNFTGDSVVVNGITITNHTTHIDYGANATTMTSVYGNLAYANVTVGDENGKLVVKRYPFFLYYKGTNFDGSKADPHSFDILGVDSEYDLTFADGTHLQSPFAIYDPGVGLTKGFKMKALTASKFTDNPTYISGLVTVGLTAADVSGTDYFVHQLQSYPTYGYPPYVPTNIYYNNSTVLNAPVVYDTGTEPYSYVQDSKFTQNNPGIKSPLTLKTGNTVKLTTTDGFNYNYTITANDNLTVVENPSVSKSTVTVMGLDFFLHNSYMINYETHTIGLKNN